MAQAMIDAKKTNSSSQTGEESQVYYIDDSKSVKLYYSTVYKEKVVSLNLSSSKSFIFTKRNWKKFRKLIPQIEDFYENENI